MTESKYEIALFGGGCFWCTEAVFDELRGVHSVVSGYAGGETKNPTYEQVCSGRTGHAEVIRVEFDPAEVTFKDLMTVFFATHDPTTLNRQGNDVGTQYRSVIFYADEAQKEQAAAFIRELDEAKTFRGPIVTTLEPLEEFYPAEDYHQKFFCQQSLSTVLPILDSAEAEQAAQAIFAVAQVPRPLTAFLHCCGRKLRRCYAGWGLSAERDGWWRQKKIRRHSSLISKPYPSCADDAW